MTIPVERMRALRWGHELLAEIQEDPKLPKRLKRRAKEIALHYPAPLELVRLLEANADELPHELGVAINDAARLFNELRCSRYGTEQTRRSLVFTLRHYPAYAAESIKARFGTAGGLTYWLAPED